MTSVRVHGAIVYCLNSGSEGFLKGIPETGGVMDKCVQMWTRNYGALGQTARGKRRKSREKRTRESGRENGRKEEERRKRERGDGKRLKESRGESEARLEWRKRAESGNWSEKDDEHRWR
ncbi:hypothetical protein TNCV_2606021 [Trichonephila clavipes]|nr:hypothetical protein TNCV_2606021 [Trichonephila clavipes]